MQNNNNKSKIFITLFIIVSFCLIFIGFGYSLHLVSGTHTVVGKCIEPFGVCPESSVKNLQLSTAIIFGTVVGLGIGGAISYFLM